MTLLASFFSFSDVLFFPICVIVCYFILRRSAQRVKDPVISKLYYKAFYFKIFCVVVFTLITEFYFKGGDTGLYYQAIKDMRAAIEADSDNFWVALTSPKLESSNPLFPFFYYDNYADDLTYGYMISPHNFFTPRLGLIPSYVFGNSYISINMCFGFFALIGAIRLFKFFYYFYPNMYREIAIATLFLPGVAYWSSGLLKDPATFACIGIILYAILNIFFRKKNIFSSIIWILFCGYLLLVIKVYILLVLVLSVLIWQFAEFNKMIKDTTLRRIFTLLTFSSAAVVGFFMLNYLTSFEAAQDFQLNKLIENAERERNGYQNISQQLAGTDSHFELNTSNPVLLILNGVVATFYRPFIWEINTPIALLSAIESFAFLLLTINFFIRKGIREFFAIIFSDGRILMCFVFAIVFAIGIGSATANFGALSRYKIPCTAFYLVMLLLTYRKAQLAYPQWFKSVINLVLPIRRPQRNIVYS